MSKTNRLAGILFQSQSETLWYEKLGWAGAQLFALTSWFSIFFAQIGLGMMLIALIFNLPQAKKQFANSAIFWISMVWLTYLALSAIVASYVFPQTVLSQARAFKQFFCLNSFLLFAYWLNADSKRIRQVLLLALGGLVFGIVLNQDWSKWTLLLQGIRSGRNKWSYFTLGLYASTALLGMFAFSHRFLTKSKGPWIFVVRIVAWIALVLVFLQEVIASQNKSTWIASAVTYIVLVIWYTRVRAKTKKTKRKIPQMLFLPVLIGLFCISVILFNIQSIQERLDKSKASTLSFLSGDFGKIDPFSSLGCRIRMNVFGLQQWEKRPWFGWGVGINANRFLADPNKNPVVSMHAHLHNTYLELLFRFGIVGTLIFSLLNLLILLSLWDAFKTKKIGQDIFLTVTGAFLLTLISSLADYRLMHFDFCSYFVLFTGIACTHKLGFSPQAPNICKRESPRISLTAVATMI
jgi:O-antigen ligase